MFDLEDPRRVEVALGRRLTAERVGLIGQTHVQTVNVQNPDKKTPTDFRGVLVRDLLDRFAADPAATEITVGANPETVTPGLAALLREHGVNRVSLGAQTFQAHLLAILERRAGPEDVRSAVRTLRDAGFDNISLDLIYGIPGQSVADLERDLAEVDPAHDWPFGMEELREPRLRRPTTGEVLQHRPGVEAVPHAVAWGSASASSSRRTPTRGPTSKCRSATTTS